MRQTTPDSNNTSIWWQEKPTVRYRVISTRQFFTSGKKDIEFKKKPELALELIDRSLERRYRPGIVLIDAGYGNNTTFLLQLEKRKLKYLGGLAKNRKVITEIETNKREEMRLDKLA